MDFITDHKMDEKDIMFVVRHYRSGCFSTDKGWRRLGIDVRGRWWRLRVAAAVVATIVLSATAAVLYRHYTIADRVEPVMTLDEGVTDKDAIKVIDFENTPLTEVVERIRVTYGVEVLNVPENAESYRLSLHYEGTAEDLVDTINDILYTDMEVER